MQGREAFLQAFFRDLTQQPLGPGVVGSVGTFLTRVEGLAKSKEPDARKVLETLIERGLTHKRIAAMRELLAQFECKEDGGAEPDEPREQTLGASEIEKARKAQLDALESLRDWWNDWATTLRSAFSVKDQITLGLTVVTRSSSSDDETTGEPDTNTDETRNK